VVSYGQSSPVGHWYERTVPANLVTWQRNSENDMIPKRSLRNYVNYVYVVYVV